MSKLTEFWIYNGKTQDGDTLEDVLGFSNQELERGHTYIQWIFPLDEPSRAQPRSPVLTTEDIETLKGNNAVALKMGMILGLMADFYGFAMTTKGEETVFVKSRDFDALADNWLSPRNHNFLRLTRMIKSLKLLGFEYYAKALQKFLLDIADEEENKNIIGYTTRSFWQEAIA
jgi:hypothetical protein